VAPVPSMSDTRDTYKPISSIINNTTSEVFNSSRFNSTSLMSASPASPPPPPPSQPRDLGVFRSCVCKGTSIRFLTFPLLSSIIFHSLLLPHTHSCLYVLSPTLCTITRYQTLEVDDSRAYYCRRHSTPPSALTSEALDQLWMHWDRSV
jgi:hypothetical protein